MLINRRRSSIRATTEVICREANPPWISVKPLLFATTILILLGIAFWPGFAESKVQTKDKPATTDKIDALSSIEKKWGIKLLGVRWSAAGYMLDFRYRVLDVKKAEKILDRSIPATVTVEKSGATLTVPRPPTTGRLRASAKFPQKDRNYFMFFANPGRHVAVGDKVTITIGDFKVKGLTVQ